MKNIPSLHRTLSKARRFPLCIMAAMLPFLVHAAPSGSTFTYQGRLNFTGAPVPDGLYDFRFTLHDAGTAGASVGSAVTVNAIGITNGLFTAQLDFGAPAFTSGEARWLQLEVNTNGVMPLAALNPRQRLTPTPQAIYAGNAGTASAVAPGAVTTLGLAADAVDGEVIFDGSISAADLAPSLLNGTFWKLSGNAGAGNFLGSTDNQPVEFRANNQTALRLLPNATSPNVVGGHAANVVNAGRSGAFIGGGGSADDFNVANGNYAAVGGGIRNRAFGDSAFIGGGSTNWAEQHASFIGGGSRNSVGRPYATVSGGFLNTVIETNGTIGGGSGNLISGDQAGSTIGGGRNNRVIQSQDGTIAGGLQNHITGNSPTAAIGGGYQNFIETNGFNGTIGGGYFNLLTESYATIGGGRFNAAHGENATIGGGGDNTIAANSSYATIPGGLFNRVGSTSDFSTVGGGEQNSISDNATSAVVGGGYQNGNAASYSVLAGGFANAILQNSDSSVVGGGSNSRIYSDSPASVVGGGASNTILSNAPSATIAGGFGNTIGTNASFSTIGGGNGNTMVGGNFASTIAGGYQNDLGTNASSSAIGGGQFNSMMGGNSASTIAGGYDNDIGTNSNYAAIGGGLLNKIARNAHYATIPGGQDNFATNHAFAAGRRAKANHTGSFVWADDTDADFTSTTNKQFAVRANNGVMIQSSTTALDLRGGGGVRVEGAGVNTTTPIFTHRATAANISGPETRIDHPHCNGKPNAILILTYNFNPAGLAGIRNDRPFGLYYNGTRWAIYNFDGTAMPVGAAYNVLVANP